MIITRTPFRISFFGGGTDYPSWYNKTPGAVLSATIDKYCYISCRYLPPFFKYKYRIRYAKREEVLKISEIKHPTVKACLSFLKVNSGIDMIHASDLPARSGIGSSSSFTVGFLNALNALLERRISKRELALQAIHIEQNIVKENIGAQDQVATCYGGFNKIIFNKEKIFDIQPIPISDRTKDILQAHLALVFTGFVRTSSKVVGAYINLFDKRQRQLSALREMVDTGLEVLLKNDFKGFGKLLHASWLQKREISKFISSNEIDAIYEKARKFGAYGGKICGAGSGGFLLLCLDPDRKQHVIKKLGLLHVPFSFEDCGSQVILR